MNSRILIYRKWLAASKKYLSLPEKIKWWEVSLKDCCKILRNLQMKNISSLMKLRICWSALMCSLRLSNSVLPMGLIRFNLNLQTSKKKYSNKFRKRNHQPKLIRKSKKNKKGRNILWWSPKPQKLRILLKSMKCRIAKNQPDISSSLQRRNQKSNHKTTSK